MKPPRSDDFSPPRPGPALEATGSEILGLNETNEIPKGEENPWGFQQEISGKTGKPSKTQGI